MLRGVAARALHLSRGSEKPSGRVTYIVVLEEIPRIFGVLTCCDDMDQALNRAGGKAGNKGVEAALTVIEMASLFRHHLGGQSVDTGFFEAAIFSPSPIHGYLLPEFKLVELFAAV